MPRRPQRPGEGGRAKPVDQVKEAGISAVDWVDERTSVSGGLRWMMFRNVPRGTDWFYTLGSATMFAFLSQATTGVFLAPFAGPYLADFLRGGAEFGATTLSRFYAIHMLLVPGAMAALIGAHLYLVARLGTTAPPWLKPDTREESPV